MPFNHDNMIGVRLAEELVNLEAEHRWTIEDVGAALARGLVRLDDFGGDALDELGQWSTRLRAAFTAAGSAARCATINGLLEEGVRRVHLVEHDGLPAHLHFAGPDADVTQRVKAMTAGSLAVFATESGASRMGVCLRAGCGRVFADTSRNGRRAYCSAQCGNASAVDRYRQRRGGSD